METGALDILNCGAGHIAMKFDKDNPEEVVKARKMITDMMRRGYLILVTEADGSTRRVKRFDPTRDEYIIEEMEPATPKPIKRTRRLPVHTTKATAVGRTAGG